MPFRVVYQLLKLFGSLINKDRLSDPTTDADEVNMDIQKGYGTKDTSGTLSSVNPPISVAAP